MTEGYLILGDDDNIDIVSLLATSIKSFDSDRKIAVVTYKDTKKIEGVDIIVNAEEFIPPSTELQYFYRVIKSPFDRTIAFISNQLLLSFDVNVWETLRGLGPVVLHNKRYSYSYEEISADSYWDSRIEKETFDITPVLNAGYFDKTLGSDDIMGLAMDIAGKYDHIEYVEWLTLYKLNDEVYLPKFPDNLWPEWIVAFIATITENKIKFYNFINCVDLKKQDNNAFNDKWKKQSWNKFLNYWVTEEGQIKIENFIQTGLLHYGKCNWLSKEDLINIKNNV